MTNRIPGFGGGTLGYRLSRENATRRLQEDKILHGLFVCLSHYTIRGAAGVDRGPVEG